MLGWTAWHRRDWVKVSFVLGDLAKVMVLYPA